MKKNNWKQKAIINDKGEIKGYVINFTKFNDGSVDAYHYSKYEVKCENSNPPNCICHITKEQMNGIYPI